MKRRLFIWIMILLIALSPKCFGEGLNPDNQEKSTICLIDLYSNFLTNINDATGYKSVIEDAAGLIKIDEIESVIEAMTPVTDFCNIGFVTYSADGSNTLSSTSKAHLWGKIVFDDRNPYVVFIIDMKTRFLSIYTNLKNELTDLKRMNTITDEVHLFATNGEYGTCACEAFSRIYKAIEGKE